MLLVRTRAQIPPGPPLLKLAKGGGTKLAFDKRGEVEKGQSEGALRGRRVREYSGLP
jgi:hypothetical protein